MQSSVSRFLLEVMDKEPTLLETCLLFGAVGSVGFVVGRWKRWLSLLPFALSVVFALGLYEELSDPYVGEAILREAGWHYVLISYVAMGFGVIVPVMGFIAGTQRHKRAVQ